MTRKEIHHLLWRAGFGPDPKAIIPTSISRRELVDQLINGRNIQKRNNKPDLVADDAQSFMAMKEEDKEATIKASKQSILKMGMNWLDDMANGQSPLRERMMLFWHDHFACEAKWDKLVHNYLNTLRQHSLGSFRELLYAMCKEPMLLKYLDNHRNKATAPNENFARELLELFSMGEGYYSEKDIKEAARAFTGHGFDLKGDYIFRPFMHDYDQKSFMGKQGRLDADDIVDHILEQPQTAYYITSKIYRYFVHTDHQPPDRIKRLAQQFYASDYDISRLMETLFLSDWFYDEENIGQKIKSPMDLVAGLMKQCSIEFKKPQTFLMISKIIGQVPFNPPNVAGWPIGRQWIDSSSLLFRMRVPDFLFFGHKVNQTNKNLAQMEMSQQIDHLVEASDKVSHDLEPLFKVAGNGSEKEKIRNLSEFLLQNNTVNEATVDWVDGHVDNDNMMLLNIMRLPEYQLC